MTTKVISTTEFKRVAVSSAITRPNNATQYAAGDVVAAVTTSNHFTFAGATSKAGGTGRITNARITSSANQSTKLDGELWLFHTDIAEVGDNVAFAPSDAEMLTRIGIIDFATASWVAGKSDSGADGNSGCETTGLDIVFKAATTDIYDVLVARNTYTPVSSEVFTIQLMIEQDF